MAENKWKSLRASGEGSNDLYDFLNTTQKKSDAIFTVINKTLTVVQTALGFAQSLLVGIDLPTVAVIKLTIKAIEDFKRDLENAGGYFTYDKEIANIFDDPYKLGGGYSAFEQRMVDKLTNKEDPTRPDFSDLAYTLSYTFHAGADTAQAMRVYKTIKQLIDLFGVGGDTTLPRPANVRLNYYSTFFEQPDLIKVELPVEDITQESLPKGIKATWTMAKPKKPNPLFPSIPIAPSGFLVVVSTRKDPCLLYRTYKDYFSKTTKSTLVLNENRPIPSHLACLLNPNGINFDSTSRSYFSFKKTPSSTVELTYEKALEESIIIPFDVNSFGDFFTGIEYSLDVGNVQISKLVYNDLYGSPIKNFEDLCVSVYSYSEEPNDDEVYGADSILPIIEITNDKNEFKFSQSKDLSLPTKVATIKNPNSIDAGYIDAVRNALYLFALSRGDLADPKVIVEEVSGSSLMAQVRAGNLTDGFVKNPFPLHLRQRVCQLMGVDNGTLSLYPVDIMSTSYVDTALKKLKKNSAAKSFISSNYETITALNNLQLKDILDVGRYGYIQQSAYRYAGADQDTVKAGGRLGLFIDEIRDQGYTKDYPIFVGNLATLKESYTLEQYYENAELVTSIREAYSEAFPHAIKILGATPREDKPTTGEWIDVRIFDKIGLSEFTDPITDFLKSLLKSQENILKAILDYIGLLSVRIDEIQKIINRIKSAIDAILAFRLPASVDYLCTVSMGTEGIVTDLQNSVDKPQVEGISAGAMLVFGGLPEVVFELIIGLFGGPNTLDGIQQRIEDSQLGQRIEEELAP